MVPDPPEEENDPAAKDIAAAVDTEDQQYVEEMPRHYHAHMTLAERRSRGTEDKAAGQCWGNLGVQQVDSLTTLLDLAVADATVHSYRRRLHPAVYRLSLPQKSHRSRESPQKSIWLPWFPLGAEADDGGSR